MATLSGDDYVFKKTSDGVYFRKAFGIEATGCKMGDMCDGFTHLISSAAVKINGLEPAPTRATLEPSVFCAAWTAMRHQVPAIACKCFKLPPPDDTYAFRYSAPKSAEEVDTWVKETVFFTDDVKPMREAYRVLKDGHWWIPSDDHYVAELHISPSEEGWNVSVSLLHSFFDGRAAFSMLEVFLDFLMSEIQGKAKHVSSIEWGTETVRLQPTASFIRAIVETGRPPEIPVPPKTDEKAKESQANGVEKPQPTVKPWLYAPVNVGGHGNISRDITFSHETTEKIHAAAKKHGYTITQLFTALFILAHTEAEFRAAANRNAERFHELSGSFKDATHYLIAWTFMNHRHKLPGGHDSYKSEAGSPTQAQDGESPIMPMDPVRSMFKLDETYNSVGRVVDGRAFWDGLVATVAATWKAIDQSLDAYLTRATTAHFTSQNFQPSVFHISALIISSIGDLGRLGILKDYLPDSSRQTSTQTPSVVVEDVITGLRCTLAPMVNLLYQYNGRLLAHLGTSGEYTSEETLDSEINILREWVEEVISGL